MKVLITGANRGIGLEFVRQYLSRGDKIIATSRNPEKAEKLKKLEEKHAASITIMKLDVTDKISIDNAYKITKEKFGELDLLINNAAINSGDESGNDFKFGELYKEDILNVLNTNTVGPLLISERFVDLLEKGTNPKIINISSGMASIGEKAGYSYKAYSISKAGLNMASKLLSNELKARGIGVWPLDPGWNRTRMGGPHATSDPKDTVSSMIKVINDQSLGDSGKFLVWDGSLYPW
jgi:NAD(P)-dependent dehydrogenase (short-subunit alcohol dehydrogenase family)